MIEVKEAIDVFLENFDRIEKEHAAKWLLPIRKSAIARFADLGFPTTKDEEWRFTNVAAIAETPFAPAPVGASVDAKRIVPFLFSTDVHLIVFVNGAYSPDLSVAGELPNGVRVMSLAAAMAADDAVLQEHLGRHVKFEDQAFAALNTALMKDGAFVHVPRGTIVERPIHVVFVTTATGEPIVTHPRNLYVAEESSEARIVETHIGLGDGKYFANAVSELVVQENATLDHYKLLREGERAFHVGTTQLHQFRDSNGCSFTGSFNGALARNDMNTMLDGEGCDCGLNGLYMVDGERHVDNHLKVEHAKPHCDSREYFKGILDGRGKGIFSGRIMVWPDAQKTDAKQTNSSLLLSRDAQVESQPQLEIFADDVKCTHGATIGQIDKDAMFYLRSRGIHKDAAQSLMIYAFAGDVLDRVRIDPLREMMAKIVLARLPKGELLKEV